MKIGVFGFKFTCPFTDKKALEITRFNMHADFLVRNCKFSLFRPVFFIAKAIFKYHNFKFYDVFFRRVTTTKIPPAKCSKFYDPHVLSFC